VSNDRKVARASYRSGAAEVAVPLSDMDAIVELATVGADGPTGQLRDRAGVVPW